MCAVCTDRVLLVLSDLRQPILQVIHSAAALLSNASSVRELLAGYQLGSDATRDAALRLSSAGWVAPVRTLAPAHQT